MGRGRDRGDSKKGRGGKGSYKSSGGKNGGSFGGGGMLRHVLTLAKNVVKSATKTNIPVVLEQTETVDSARQ